MTIIAICATKQPETILAFSDSRVSDNRPLLDSVAKLLPVPIQVFNNDLKVVATSAFGFAFAGSTLVAQAVYCFAIASLQSIRAAGKNTTPALFEIAEYIREITYRIGMEMGQRLSLIHI